LDESSDISTEFFEGKNSNPFPPFGTLSPKITKFTALFPEYPKSHIEGHAIIIELNRNVAMKLASDQKFRSEMLKTLQYSRDNKSGDGWRRIRQVQFFAVDPPATSDIDLPSDEDEDDSELVPMLCCVRKCAGVKTCEFFEVTSHTEVNPGWLGMGAGTCEVGEKCRLCRRIQSSYSVGTS
jgi:hypothetical protein